MTPLCSLQIFIRTHSKRHQPSGLQAKWSTRANTRLGGGKYFILHKLKLVIVPASCMKLVVPLSTKVSAPISLIIPFHNMKHISSSAITFITRFSKYLRAQWVNNRSRNDLHMNDVCEWEWVTEEGCLSIVRPGRFAPLCPHSKGQVRFSDTKGQVKICSAWMPKTLIMMLL